MRVAHAVEDLAGCAGGTFVPTMGAMHEGHLALVRHARTLAAPVVVSIFVNPTQFAPGEDLDRYPRTLEADLDACRHAGVDVAFCPPVEVVYPPGETVAVPPLPAVATGPGLEEAARPGHFAGVCQVVARLFDLVRPRVALFGEKDYQQLLVIEAMVAAAGTRWGELSIERCPTVREPDGLAMSSRNRYLEPGERDRALGLVRALNAARDAWTSRRDADATERTMREVLAAHGLDIEYAEVRDAASLRPVAGGTARALIAVRLGKVRLIDNMEIGGVPA